MRDPECIFCKIAAGEVGTLVYDGKRVAAFADASPKAPVHILVVPKDHHENILDGVPAETLAEMVEAVRQVTAQTGIDKTGFRIVVNTGHDSGQEVQHLHWHVLGGVPLAKSPFGAA